MWHYYIKDWCMLLISISIAGPPGSVVILQNVFSVEMKWTKFLRPEKTHS